MSYLYDKVLRLAPQPYDRGMGLLTLGPWERLHRDIADRIGMRDRVLDLGCGTGALAALLAERRPQVTGINVSSLMVALRMLAEAGEEKEGHNDKASGRDAEKLVLYPLTVPYLLNPAGITLLAIFSGTIDSWLILGIMVILALLLRAQAWLILSNPDRIAEQMDKSCMAVTEAVFGMPLAALAVELMLTGLANPDILDIMMH